MSEPDKNCLSYWFPLVQAAGLPVPRTVILRTTGSLWDMLDGLPCAAGCQLVRDIANAALTLPQSVPFFLRSGQTSGKHDWNTTCCVKDLEGSVIYRHVWEIVEYSECCSIIGLPHDVWAVREMLKTPHVFYAFHGRMPVTREFRFFVRDGTIEHEQFYWPEDALDKHVDEKEFPAWREWLKIMATQSLGERRMLHELALQASAAVPGFWSVDFLADSAGKWWLIDMANGEESFRYWPDGRSNRDA